MKNKRRINRLCDKTAKELSAELNQATERLSKARTDETRLTYSRLREEARTRLLVCRAIDGRYFVPVARKVRDVVQRLTDLIIDLDGNTTEVNRAIEQADSEIFESIRETLEKVATDQIKERSRDVWPRVNAAQLSRMTGLSFDRFRNVKPESTIPPKIQDPELPLKAILEHMSPLLFIEGDSYLNDQIDVVADLFNDIKPKDLVEAYDTRDKKVSDNYRTKLNRVSAGVNISSLLRADERAEAVKRLNDTYFGKGTDSGVIGRIRNELRHESLRIVKHSKEAAIEVIDDNVLVGYVLYSRFLQTSDPVHIANSGNRYFKDNRTRDNFDDQTKIFPWRKRIIPPYRKNCVCYTLEIFETPKGFLRTAPFKAASLSGGRKIGKDDVGGEIWDHNKGIDKLGRRVGGFRRITEADVGKVISGGNAINVLEPRDVGDLRTWFNGQFPGIRRTLFGPNRFAAVKRRAEKRGEPNYRPRYEDFFTVTGEIMTAKQLAQESKNKRAVRVRGVKRLIDQITENHHKAWEAGNGRYALDPIQEGRFRNVLQRWLKNLPKQSRR